MIPFLGPSAHVGQLKLSMGQLTPKLKEQASGELVYPPIVTVMVMSKLVKDRFCLPCLSSSQLHIDLARPKSQVHPRSVLVLLIHNNNSVQHQIPRLAIRRSSMPLIFIPISPFVAWVRPRPNSAGMISSAQKLPQHKSSPSQYTSYTMIALTLTNLAFKTHENLVKTCDLYPENKELASLAVQVRASLPHPSCLVLMQVR